MDVEIKMMLNAVIEEMGQMEERINKRMDKRFDETDERFNIIENQLEIMQHEINACNWKETQSAC